MLKDFKDFLLRGNLIELAVAFVMAAAFGAVVTSFTENVIMQIVALIFGQPNFDSLAIVIGDTPILYGAFLTALVNFVFIAAAIFFFVVKPYEAYKAKTEEPAEEAPAGPSEIDLLIEIRDSLRAR
ncbi:MAG TPA: large conductance mechanosensitive channel protein MscL [Actinobacteria bacterium]|nr:large conductance mechanosensitive channel protein MscL [Actinomycetota bacterium]